MGKPIYSKKSFDFPWADLWCLCHCRFHLLFLHLQRHLKTFYPATFSSSNLFAEKGRKKIGFVNNQVTCCKWASFKCVFPSVPGRRKENKVNILVSKLWPPSHIWTPLGWRVIHAWILCSFISTLLSHKRSNSIKQNLWKHTLLLPKATAIEIFRSLFIVYLILNISRVITKF